MKTPPMTLAGFLERSRLSQAMLARLVGISQPYLSELVRGRKCPSLRVAVRLEKVTKIPMEAFLKGGGQ